MKTVLYIFLLGLFIITGVNAQVQNKPKDPRTDPKWQETKYGEWGGPGVSSRPGPMDELLLKDFAPKSSVISKTTFVPKAKYPVIDVHTHILARTPNDVAEWVKTMDEVGIEISVVLTGATGEAFDKLADLYLKAYPNRFQLYCGIEMTNMDAPDYPKRVVDELVRCYKKGARGVGEASDKGLGFSGDANLPRQKRLHPNDKRLEGFWNKCAELKLPVNIHIADHPSAWQPLDVYQERTPDYQHFNQYGKDLLSYDELISAFEQTLMKHPKTTFIACHMVNLGNDLDRLSSMMKKYPNLHLDISARDYEIGRTPRAATRFLEMYKDRVMFGTDMGRVKKMYQAWWRLLETDDEYMTGRVWWPYYGLALSPNVLESLYRNTALKTLNWQKL